MIASKHDKKFWFLIAGISTLLYLALVAFAHVAHADTGTVAAATQATDTGWDIVVHQGPLFGALLLGYGVFRRFLAANESKHWIAQGKTLSVLTGVGMVAGAVVDWHFDGGPPAAIMTALFAAVSLVMHSTVKSGGAA